MNPRPKAAKYGIILERAISPNLLLPFCFSQIKGMSKNDATMIMLAKIKDFNIIGKGFSNDKKNGLSSVTG